MKFQELIATAIRGLHRVIGVFVWIGAVVLGLVMLFIVANILGRFLFNRPVQGTIEAIELFIVMVVFLSMAYTEVRKGHVSVELLTSRFPKGVQAALARVMYFVSAAFFGVTAWRVTVLMWTYISPSIRTTDIVRIPIAPFIFMIALGSLLLCLELLLNGLYRPSPAAGGKDEVA